MKSGRDRIPVLQDDLKEKKNKIRSRIEAKNHGRLWILDNSDLGSARQIRDTFDEIVRHFGLEDRSPR